MPLPSPLHSSAPASHFMGDSHLSVPHSSSSIPNIHHVFPHYQSQVPRHLCPLCRARIRPEEFSWLFVCANIARGPVIPHKRYVCGLWANVHNTYWGRRANWMEEWKRQLYVYSSRTCSEQYCWDRGRYWIREVIESGMVIHWAVLTSAGCIYWMTEVIELDCSVLNNARHLCPLCGAVSDRRNLFVRVLRVDQLSRIKCMCVGFVWSLLGEWSQHLSRGEGELDGRVKASIIRV